jgi:hypothetical protein
VSFFAYANSNQMPIRRIVVDWGDGDEGILPWPTDSQSGSKAPDNFYTNHRGKDPNSNDDICEKNDEFGRTPESCSSSFVAFSHDYVCTPGLLSTLQKKQCQYAPDGRLFNSPCTDGKRCIYQPRVHVKDNWGWCTGFCNAGDDGTNGCFEGEPANANDECRINVCPSEGKIELCPDKKNGTTVNPWVNYDGYVIIEP